MNCDAEFGDISEPLPNRSFFMVVTGPGGSGKTNLIQNLFRRARNYRNYFKAFHNLVMIAPPASRASLQKDVFDCPGILECDELSGDCLNEVKEQVEAESREGFRTCMIIDDMASSLKDKDVIRELSNLINNRRHYRLSIILIVPYYNSIPLQVRRPITAIAIFHPNNKRELDSVFSELIPLSKEKTQEVSDYVYDSRHNFMFIDVETGKIHKNFNQLEIK